MVSNDQSRSGVVPASWADPAPAVAAGSRWRRAVPLLVWGTCLGVAVALLVALGDGRLAAPPLTDPSGWQAWATGRDPLEVVMVVLRLVALAVAWYLTGVTSISVIARVLRAARLVRVADVLSVGPVKVLVQQALGISLAAGVVASNVPGGAVPGRAAASADRVEVAVMAVLDDAPAQSGAEGGQAVMVPVPAPASSSTPTPAPPPAPALSAAPSPVPSPASPSSPSSTAAPVTADQAPADEAAGTAAEPDEATDQAGPQEVHVRSGDHFWGLAEQAVADHLGRPGSEGEVLAHWEAMLIANADRLVVAGSPDLLLPGQAIIVPDVAEVLP